MNLFLMLIVLVPAETPDSTRFDVTRLLMRSDYGRL